jgi:hypothetical protein
MRFEHTHQSPPPESFELPLPLELVEEDELVVAVVVALPAQKVLNQVSILARPPVSAVQALSQTPAVVELKGCKAL